MKLVTFEQAGRRRIGAYLAVSKEIVDFRGAADAPYFHDMLALIDGAEQGLAHANDIVASNKSRLPADSVKLLAPVPEPRQMRDFLCFEKHLRQARANRYLFNGGERTDPAKVDVPKVWYDQPIYYKCNRFSVVGTGADVILPNYCKMFDYELEFGIFLGKRGKNFKRDEAHKAIFGYCIFNDYSARDAQMSEMQGQLGPAKGKDFDTGNAMGPWLVTADEISDPYNLTMVARVNGEEWSRGNSGTMQHKFEDVLMHASREETLYPGEFFGSGTVGGGCGLELAKFLKAGDVVELEIEGLGKLTNRIVASV